MMHSFCRPTSSLLKPGVASLWLLLLLLVTLMGCAPTLSYTEATALRTTSLRLLDIRDTPGDIPATEWPPDIAALAPERVYITDNGLYIVTSAFFVNERGLYVPRPNSDLITTSGEDPQLTALTNGIFAYHIKG